MATITCWSLDFTKQLDKKKHQEEATNLVRNAEKRAFPRNEALDFGMELQKRNTDLMIIMAENPTKNTKALVGYIACTRHNKTVLLHKVCVIEAYRRRGVARKMLEMQLKKFKSQGCEKAQLWVDEKRMPARCLYSALGFLEMNLVENYYAPGRMGIQMVLSLLAP